MKTILRTLIICLLVVCGSCGKIADKEVTITYVGGNKPVRLGDYYWSNNGDSVTAVDSKTEIAGIIYKSENPSDFHTVVDFIKNSSPGSAR